ncbi:MAG: DegV family protein [Clostridiales bacterium]|nr:DegV family protein [Clostridiales bacterium]
MKKENRIAITTDSNSGILPNEYEEQGVFVLPMPFLVNGSSYFENVNLSQADFYTLLNADAKVSTSQPSVGELTEFWTELLKDYEELIHIPMSSGLSEACSSAKRLATEFNGKVTVVDNRRISVSLKRSVLDAVFLRDEGKTATEIKKYLEETASDSSIYIAVDTMKYLKKGGRVTTAAATIGTILKIKPVLAIKGEKLDKFALPRNIVKAKETMKNAIKNDLDTQFAKFVERGEMEIYVAHTNDEEGAKAFVEELQKFFPNVPVKEYAPLPLSVACHIGPNALAVACARVLK